MIEPGSDRWNHLAEGNARQARKRVSVDVLIRDADGRILLVDPAYKDGWDLPGGMSEANEAPRLTARRELSEELALDITPGRLLVIDWVHPRGPWDDLLSMIFDGGTLAPETTPRLNDDELKAFDFFSIDDATQRLRPDVARRMLRALHAADHGSATYTEDAGA